jgi:HD-like signal output (HDOD) protein
MQYPNYRLDMQLEELGISYSLLEAGLPRKPAAKPSFPVAVKINGQVSLCLLAEQSILTPRNLPTEFSSVETFGPDRQRNMVNQMGLSRMTLLCNQGRLYMDKRLLENPTLVLPCGDQEHYLEVKTVDLLKGLPEYIYPIDFPTLSITHQDLLDQSSFTKTRVLQAMDGISEIPPFPVTARSIIELNMKPDFDIDRLVHIIERDAPIVSSLLSWSNAAGLNNGRGEITSVRDAINRLGTRMTMDYALQSSMMSSFRTTKELAPIVQFASFNSLHSAFGARHVSTLAHSNHQGDSYLAGLMHNLGELLMVQCFKERSRDYLIHQELNPHMSRELLSREIFKISFAQATDHLMSTWKMPTQVTEACRALASFADGGHNEIAADIRIWQVMMLDAGLIPYAHAPFGWDLLEPFPLGRIIIDNSRSKISEFQNFSMTVGQAIR